MANVFAGSEIVQMGVRIEENGRDFYEALAGKSKSKKAGDIFQYLAAEEEKHIVTFREILESVHKYEPPESYPGEYFAYMNALAGEYVFTQENKGKGTAASIKSDIKAVDLGIKFEKDSIIFYDAMKRVVPEGQDKVIDALIAQEKSHLLRLFNLKDSLK